MANGTVEAGLMSYCRVVLVTWDLSCLITAITAPQVRAGPMVVRRLIWNLVVVPHCIIGS